MTSISWRRSLISKIVTMTSKNFSYEEAIRKLNLLQSNKATIEQIKKNIKTGVKCTNIENMENYLMRTGVPLTKLDELSVIHVAGTKGKGSTSAMCECILRQHGYRTGFYSSPHLVAARERMRIAGRPLSEHAFAHHFHRVYDMLDNTQEFEGDMPKYFAFLTVMAFNVFLAEKVDVCVVEVGIGGVVDYTNVLRKVPVVGITSLGLDHTAILGNTLPEIAAAKAGIMKRGCEAYTVRQPHVAMDVLREYAQTVQCPLTTVPDYNQYEFPDTQKPHLQVDLEAYRTNASLAIQLSHAWMRGKQEKRNGFKDYVVSERRSVGDGGRIVYEIPYKTMEGLRQCKWPGRYQVVTSDYATFYLDGAHTKESMEICMQWFRDSSSRQQEKVLIFSATGDRDSETLLRPLTSIQFSHTYFVQPTAHHVTSKNNDNYSLVEQQELLQRCRNHANVWVNLNAENANNRVNFNTKHDNDNFNTSDNSYVNLDSINANGTVNLDLNRVNKVNCNSNHADSRVNINTNNAEPRINFTTNNADPRTNFNTNNADSRVNFNTNNDDSRVNINSIYSNTNASNITVLDCVSEALSDIKKGNRQPSVLITGSLHLVGAALSILDPNLSS